LNAPKSLFFHEEHRTLYAGALAYFSLLETITLLDANGNMSGTRQM